MKHKGFTWSINVFAYLRQKSSSLMELGQTQEKCSSPFPKMAQPLVEKELDWSSKQSSKLNEKRSIQLSMGGPSEQRVAGPKRSPNRLRHALKFESRGGNRENLIWLVADPLSSRQMTPVRIGLVKHNRPQIRAACRSRMDAGLRPRITRDCSTF